jgi:hypothetical protein
MRGFVLLPITLALAACNTAGSMAEPPVPDAKAIILAHKTRLWKDADSIKNASIAAPMRHLGLMWHVCVRANARNSFGGYAGERDSVVEIYDNGSPPEVVVENAPLRCNPLPHTPFPELEGGYKPAAQAKVR